MMVRSTFSGESLISHKVFASLGGILVIYLAYQIYAKVRASQEATAYGLKHGCETVPELPKRWPLGVDRIKEIWQANEQGRLLAFYGALAKEYEPRNILSQFFLFGPRLYCNLHPQNVEAILSTNFKDYGFGLRPSVFAPLLGSGIFTQEGAAWKRSRELLRKQFVRAEYKHLEQAFGEHVDNLMDRIPSNEVVDLQPLFFDLTLDTTTALLFGNSIYSLRSNQDQNAKNRAFAENFNIAQEGLAKRFRIVPFHFLYNPASFRQACRSVHTFVEDYIKERGLAKKNSATDVDSAQADSFIDQIWAEAGTVTQLRDQLLNVLLAGRDTTACCLSWAVRLLVRHPDVLQRLRKEVKAIMGDTRNPTREKLQQMPFLSCVIKETLRLYPSVPLNNREAVRTTLLPTGGGADYSSPILVQKGEVVAFSQYVTSRLKSIFGEDAEDYRPGRWETGELDGIGWGFSPFIGGPRQCLGQDFAMMEISYTLAQLLQTFPSIELPPGEVIQPIGTEKQTLTLVISCAAGCKVLAKRE